MSLSSFRRLYCSVSSTVLTFPLYFSSSEVASDRRRSFISIILLNVSASPSGSSVLKFCINWAGSLWSFIAAFRMFSAWHIFELTVLKSWHENNCKQNTFVKEIGGLREMEEPIEGKFSSAEWRTCVSISNCCAGIVEIGLHLNKVEVKRPMKELKIRPNFF